MTRHKGPGPGSRRATIAELERATAGDPFLQYLGVDGRGHRFRTLDGRAFLVARDGFKLPESIRATLDVAHRRGAALFVTIRGGEVCIPNPAAVAAWVKRQRPDEEDDPDVTPPAPRALPIVRHDASAEPAILVLTSDGDWTDADLARLDEVLASWLRNDGLIPDDPEAPRPSLVHQPGRSASDRKRIVLGAEGVPSGHLESLASWLGLEFPFLRALEVGQPPPYEDVPSRFRRQPRGRSASAGWRNASSSRF